MLAASDVSWSIVASKYIRKDYFAMFGSRSRINNLVLLFMVQISFAQLNGRLISGIIMSFRSGAAFFPGVIIIGCFGL